MTVPPRSEYLHGTAPDEQRRLALLNGLLNESSLRAATIRPGERVADFGCGLAQLTRAFARASGAPSLGIERDPAQLAEARRLAAEAGESGLVELRAGDIVSPPFAASEWGSFDVAHARFVLEHVPDPLAVVRAMARAVKPGGRVLLEDDDHWIMRFWPETTEVTLLWRGYVESYSRLGNDPQVGRKLVSLLHDSGMTPRRNQWLFFGTCAGETELFPLWMENLVGVYDSARAEMIASGSLDAESYAAAIAALREWGRRRDAAVWFARCWAEGVKPAGR